MKKNMIGWLFTGLMVWIFSGCIYSNGKSFDSEYEKTVQIEHLMKPQMQFVANTDFGDVNIVGEQTDRCRVTAHVKVQAETMEMAVEITNQIEVKLVPSQQGIEAVINRPQKKSDYSASVDLTIYLPSEVDLDIKTSYGDIEISNIQGNMKADTSFGDLNATQVTGAVKLNTSYGDIRCSEIQSSLLEMDTSFGDVAVSGLQSKSPLTAKINTSYGNIDFACPAEFGGQVEMETHFGKIQTQKAITIKGQASQEQLSGTIGTGSGLVKLQTSFGDICLK